MDSSNSSVDSSSISSRSITADSFLNSATCSICGDRSSGIHYKVLSCDGCRGFFKRAVRNNIIESCKNENLCQISKESRNSCKSCRFKKCLSVGMEPTAVQQKREKVVVKAHGIITSGFSDTISSIDPTTFPSKHCFSMVDKSRDHIRSINYPHLNYISMHNHFENSGRKSPIKIGEDEKKDDSDLFFWNSNFIKESWVLVLKSSLEEMITWLNEVPFLLNLTENERCMLMEQNWCPLFLISLAKNHSYFDQKRMISVLYLEHQRLEGDSSPVEMETISPLQFYSDPGKNRDHFIESSNLIKMKIRNLYDAMAMLYRIREIIYKIVQLELDSTDMSYIKCLALMNPGPEDYNFWIRVTRTYQELMSSFVNHLHEKNVETGEKSVVSQKIGVIMTTLSSIKCIRHDKLLYALSPVVRFKKPIDRIFWSIALSKYRRLSKTR